MELVEKWNISRNRELTIEARQAAFGYILTELSPILNRTANKNIQDQGYHISQIDIDDVIQNVFISIWYKATNADLIPLPEVSFPGQVVDYFKRSVIRSCRHFNNKYGIPAKKTKEFESSDNDEIIENAFISKETKNNYKGFDLPRIISIFAKKFPFCSKLINRYYVLHKGVTYKELRESYMEDYGSITKEALAVRNSDCMKKLKKLITREN
jgi:hypothetical protein